MVFSSMPNYNLDPTANWNHQDQQQGNNTEVHHHHHRHHPRSSYIPLLPPPYPPVHSQPPTTHHQGVIRPGFMTDQARKANMSIPETFLKCPRCASLNTKFCYYNNYSLSQPRYFCKNCRRYWTQGGSLRNVPVGGGCRKNRSSSKGGGGGGGGSSTSTRSKSPSNSGSTPSNNSAGYSSSHHLIRNSGSHVQPSPVSFMAPLNHLSDYSIADIGANYPGLIPQVLSSPDQFKLMLGNVNRVPTSSGMEPWRFIQQQQLVQQYHHPTFFDGNSEIPLSATTTNLYEDQSGVTPRENDHKLLDSITAAGPDAQMDLLKLERNISSCYNGASRAQFMSRPHLYSWSGAASENRNVNNNGNSPSAPTNAWTDLISKFNSTSSTTLHPS